MFRQPPRTPVKDRLQRGLYEDGVWKCNCNPRQPAPLRTVYKENHNQGRRFYCCPNSEDTSCRFFLWESDALPRQTPPETKTANGQLPTPAKSPVKRRSAGLEDAVTPRKEGRGDVGQKSPGRRGLSKTEVGQWVGSVAGSVVGEGKGDDMFTTPGRSGSLFSQRSKEALGEGLVDEVMGLLTERQREEGRIEEILKRHGRITEGVVRGRTVARESLLKTKQKVVELERKLADAEQERDAALRKVEELKEQVERLKLGNGEVERPKSGKGKESGYDSDATISTEYYSE